MERKANQINGVSALTLQIKLNNFITSTSENARRND
jgi:hypothetical protein